MIILRDRVRDLSLARVGFAVETTPVSVDLGAVLAFLVAVVLLAFAWRAMLRWLFEGRGAAVRLSAHKEQVEHDA
jgi:hypothetical protein